MIRLSSSGRAAVLLVACLLLLASIAGCGGEDAQGGKSSLEPLADPGEWSPFIAAFTAGEIPRASTVRVRFVAEQVTDDQVGSDAGPERFVFEPPIEGRASWANRRELVFEPKAPLRSGTTYQAKLALADRKDFPATVFPFQFHVIAQDFDVELDELAADADDPEKRSLSGRLTTADGEPGERVEKILEAVYRGAPIPIVWSHAPGDREHRFRIAGIARDDADQSLDLRWDGGAIEVVRQGERRIVVPALGRFEISSIRPEAGDPPRIRISFSDELDPAQDVKGLVSAEGYTLSSELDGNALLLFSDRRFTGSVALRIEPGLRNRRGKRLEAATAQTVEFEVLKPAVRFVGRGVILPASEDMTIPFEAVGVDSVQVTVMRIYEDNLDQFLQTNTLEGSDELQRVGRSLWRKTIELSPADASSWGRYAFDAKELLGSAPDGMLHVTLSIDRRNSAWACPDRATTEPARERPFENWDDQYQVDKSNWDFWQSPEELQWQEREDPCTDSYFYFNTEQTRSEKNLLASNVGLLGKRGATGDLHVVVTDLRTAKPRSGAKLVVYDYQGQALASATSDAQGFARVPLPATPFLLEARHEQERGYLKLNLGTALATSHFDVGGDAVGAGVKGHLYGERGVWRPGDEMHLTFVVDDPQDTLPADHPVSLTLFDPRGQEVETWTSTRPVGRFHSFRVKTADDAPTGRWNARVQLGGMRFERPLRVETVVPNRLKVALDFGRERLKKGDMPAPVELASEWLHGASASGLTADVAVALRPRPTEFTRNPGFAFDDPARDFGQPEPRTVFEGKLDAEGHARFPLTLDPASTAPGLLEASFTSRVHEAGGGFSTEHTSIPFHPYDRYVGIKLPEGDRARGMLLTDTDHTVELATVDADGQPVSVEGLDVRLYKLDWKWWWDQSADQASLARFVAASFNQSIAQGTVSTQEGRGRWTLRIAYPEWGRYLVRACDPKGGHCAGRIVYVDWPGWAGRAQEQGGSSASALAFTADRERYAPGDKAILTLPAAESGRALVALETGSRILGMRWVEIHEGENRVEIPVTAEMAPTVYAAVTLVQAHAGKKNDRPIRLYGYLPLTVEDPGTRLAPVLEVAPEIRPRTTVPVVVREKSGRAMTYTLAVVDEGLLGLTAFKTPDLHAAFFRREALGVRTWDLFDFVVGAYGGELERLLALGGDGSADRLDPGQERKRFPPVVRFLGPFELAAGARAKHEITLPEYLGAVRFMVVAGAKHAYGQAEQSVRVRDPLMLLANLPRVLGPGESVRLPATVFATDPSLKDVDVRARAESGLTLVGAAKTRIHFERPGDALALFELKAEPRLGMAHIELEATSGAARSEATIDLPIRAANPPTKQQLRGVIEPGKSLRQELRPHGMPGSNVVALEVSSVPPLDLERRLDYLIQYPHGCLEQITSAAFPQLYVSELVALDEKATQAVERHVRTAIQSLARFQTPSGRFAYWPGDEESQAWANLYAGHFLVESAQRGYHVPPSLLGRWLESERAVARAWTTGGGAAALTQSYRLYVLAVQGSAEVGSMNRLRESGELESPTRWLLAAAYALAGLPDAAREVVKNDPAKESSELTRNETFGSATRDRALILLGRLRTGRATGSVTSSVPGASSNLAPDASADALVESLSADLAADTWLSTQSTAFALMALSDWAMSRKDVAFELDLAVAGMPAEKIASPKPILRRTLAGFPDAGGSVELSNRSPRKLYASWTTTGIAPPGADRASARGLTLRTEYRDARGEPADLDDLHQGDELVVELAVTNTEDRKLEHVALVHTVASGFEIRDPRGLDDAPATPASGAAEIEFQDVRDDRVLSYFSLEPRETQRLKLRLHATWVGRFYLPAIGVEPMYDGSRFANTAGRWVEIHDAREK